MQQVREFLSGLGLPRGDELKVPSSEKRFPDGAQYRVEIPSVEGPRVMAHVLDEAGIRGVPIHRISQGSGGMLLTDDEILDMGEQSSAKRVELSLFARPTAGWGLGAGAQFPATSTASQVRGADQLVHNIEDIRRMCSLGIRNALVTDIGVVDVVSQLRHSGELPPDLRLKASVQMGLSNPASIRVGERLGIDSYNVTPDLTLSQLAAIREAIDIPIDMYIESPDNLGGFVRHYEIAEIVRVAAPVYVKFGLRNSPDIYPSGGHLESTAIALGLERVRRAEIGLAILNRYMPSAQMSQLGASDLAVAIPVNEVQP
ncbi:U32 family peptidase [Homoserinimonas sp. OAct 916]|uniref:U32 family peptidase n=1 Tax=Homoserinimonas sp. OAct 916 TaxID=2211450 RepID=UPI000DBE5666|nr:U32 family peptidase [Homoserinimonas sp. OAct 916]